MSAGKMAGIVIGAVVALCVVPIMMHFWRKHTFTEAVRGGDEAAELDPGTNPAAELPRERLVKELDSNRPKQYDDHAAINREPVELPGDSRLDSLFRVVEQD